MINHKNQCPARSVIPFLPLILSLLSVGCATTTQTPEEALSAQQPTHLVALLPMQAGYGPDDHDAYEARIRPLAEEHGMALDAAYTVNKFLGGNGPREASTVGIWSLGSAQSLQALMSDPRYQAQVEYRDRIHDMSNTPMYLAKREFSGSQPSSGHVLLVGVLAMNQGYDFNAHDAYEKTIAPISARYGMRIYRSYRVLQKMGVPSIDNVVAVNIWELPNPEALSRVMSDPDYVAQIPVRNRIHNMKATTMYFVTPRTAG